MAPAVAVAVAGAGEAPSPGAVVLIDRLDMKNVMFNKYFAGCNYAQTTIGATCTSETKSLICTRKGSEKIVSPDDIRVRSVE